MKLAITLAALLTTSVTQAASIVGVNSRAFLDCRNPVITSFNVTGTGTIDAIVFAAGISTGIATNVGDTDIKIYQVIAGRHRLMKENDDWLEQDPEDISKVIDYLRKWGYSDLHPRESATTVTLWRGVYQIIMTVAEKGRCWHKGPAITGIDDLSREPTRTRSRASKRAEPGGWHMFRGAEWDWTEENSR